MLIFSYVELTLIYCALEAGVNPSENIIGVFDKSKANNIFEFSLKSEDISLVKFLIEDKGCNIDTVRKDISCLINWVNANSIEMVKLLFKHNIDCSAHRKRHAIIEAVKKGFIDILKFFKDQKCSLKCKFDSRQLGFYGINLTDQVSQINLVHIAAFANQIESLRFLGKSGVNMDEKNSAGNSPLEWAVALKNKEAATVLVKEFKADTSFWKHPKAE